MYAVSNKKNSEIFKAVNFISFFIYFILFFQNKIRQRRKRKTKQKLVGKQLV